MDRAKFFVIPDKVRRANVFWDAQKTSTQNFNQFSAAKGFIEAFLALLLWSELYFKP